MEVRGGVLVVVRGENEIKEVKEEKEMGGRSWLCKGSGRVQEFKSGGRKRFNAEGTEI
jgi:hypothetical protein